MSEPGYPDALPQAEGSHVRAYEIDAADDLMAGNNGVFDIRKFPVDDMEVGPADPARADFDADLAVARLWIGPLLEPKRRSGRW
jgi:hypothetical protein